MAGGWTEEDVIQRLVAQRESRTGIRRPRQQPETGLGQAIRPRSVKQGTDWSETLLSHVMAIRLPIPEREYRFDASRKWRFDLAWPDLKIAAECDGGEFSQGRHGRGYGMQSDCMKQNAAILAGWKPFRFTGSQVRSGYAIGILEKALKS